MPISAVYPADLPIKVRAWGDVTAGELEDLVREAHPHVARYCPPLLIDATGVESAPGLDDFRRILHGASDIPGINKCRIALVTKSDWLYGVGRAISAYASFVALAFEVFREERPARSWLESVDA